jgi:hypothetical protein
VCAASYSVSCSDYTGYVACLPRSRPSSTGSARTGRSDWSVEARWSFHRPRRFGNFVRGTSRGARSANPVTFCDDHRIDVVTVTGQILMAVHTLIGRLGSAESTAAVERVVERIAWKYPGLDAAMALSYGIRAGSGRRGPGHASCKRQVSGSNPLTGSQLSVGFWDFCPNASWNESAADLTCPHAGDPPGTYSDRPAARVPAQRGKVLSRRGGLLRAAGGCFSLSDPPVRRGFTLMLVLACRARLDLCRLLS